jgi:hypothetical protein
MTYNSRFTPDGLLIIETARSIELINEAAKQGLRPVVKPVQPLPEINSKYAVFQNTETGEIMVYGDYRGIKHSEPWKQIIPFTRYYPHKWDCPYAAYLVPKDIRIGDQVFIEDLIQDLVGMTWNQGDKYRLKHCVAFWNGEDFDLDYDENNIHGILG